MALLGNLAYVAFSSFCMAALTVSFGSLAARLLTNLRVYVVPEDPSSATPTPPGSGKSGNKKALAIRNRKKMSATEKEDAAFEEHEKSMGGAGFISGCDLPQSVVLSTRWFAEWDSLVYMTILQMLNLVLGEAGATLGLPGNNFIIPMSLICIVTVLYTLTKTELLAADIPSFMKVGSFLTFLANFVVAMSILLFSPSAIVDFGVPQAAREVMPTFFGFIRSKNPNVQVPDGEPMDPTILSVILALIAAFQGSLMFGPAHRAARMYFKAITPAPAWGQQFMTFGAGAKLFLHLQLVLPVIAVVMWIKPMVEMWGLSGGPLGTAQPLSLFVAGLISLPCLRPMAQAYLNLSLQHWYELKHGVKPSDRSAVEHANYIAALIRVKIQHNQDLICKVAAQLFSQGSLLLAYGSIIYACTNTMPGAVDSAAASQVLPLSFWRMLGGFLGWWSCISWFVYVGFGLIMHRIGVISS